MIIPPWVQLLEGVSLLTAGTLIAITLRRRGRDRLLRTVALFFFAGGVFRLGMFIPGALGLVGQLAFLGAVLLVITDGCLCAGIAGYVTTQLRMLFGARADRTALVFGVLVAAFLMGFHIAVVIAGAAALPFAPQLDATLIRAAIAFTGVGFLIAVGLLALALWRIRSTGVPIMAAAAAHVGVGLMLVSWVLQKIVQAEASSVHLALAIGPFVALAIVIGAVVVQTSAAMAPGVVYDAARRRPLALAIVRIFRAGDRKLLETRVTNQDGRYGILVEPGEYTLEVATDGFRFPSRQEIGYRGDVIAVKQPSLLGYDCYLDPVDDRA